MAKIQTFIYQKDGEWRVMYDGYTLPYAFETREAAEAYLKSGVATGLAGDVEATRADQG